MAATPPGTRKAAAQEERPGRRVVGLGELDADDAVPSAQTIPHRPIAVSKSV